ncbi:MAG: PH domain-containing protein [Pyrinomonadaceae bacterium]
MRYYCMSCGSSIAPGARFCPGCGTIAVDRQQTRIAANEIVSSPPHAASMFQGRNPESNEVERIVFKTAPTLLFVKAGYVVAALGSIALIVVFALMNAPPLVSIVLALALLLVPASYHLKRNAIRYTLTDSKIEIQRGLLARSTRNIPLRNIQDVTVSSSIAQRLLGIGSLVIDNATEGDGKTILSNLRQPRHHADLLLRELRRWR